jgi:hypothetical protein
MFQVAVIETFFQQSSSSWRDVQGLFPVLECLALDSLILHPVLSFSSLAVFWPVLSGPNYDFGPWIIHPVLFAGFRPIALRPRLSPGLRFRSA